MNAADFDYELPAALIAQHPPARRTDARLLHLPGKGPPIHRTFRDFPALLRRGDLLVLNETRVLPARLLLERETGGKVEALLVRPEPGGWRALVRPARRLRAGERLGGEGFRVRIDALEGGEALLSFEGGVVEDLLSRHGRVPLPPYIRREPVPSDRERYQTVYARVPGAVAAPTAGLHFDQGVLREVESHGVGIARLVLHVGPGSFRPLADGDLGAQSLDPERYAIGDDTRAALDRTRREGGRVVAVGTTVVRALEADARRSDRGAAEASTALFIHPPFDFRVVDAMLTNFHLPRSSLLCLVAAFAGTERVLAAYAEAVRERYRFYSYGDATFLEGTGCSSTRS